MSLEEKVGQLFILGFHGQDLSQGLKRTLRELKPGGIVVFKKNIGDLPKISELNRSAQMLSFQYSKTPLLIAVDQEGGIVTRIQMQPAQPSPQFVGKAKNSALTFSLGNEVGETLRKLGFNMNLAPVMDVVPANSKSFIGTRSFGSDPYLVSTLGVAFSQGLADAGVMPTAKHFPGSGDIVADPHLEKVIQTDEKNNFFNTHILPYKDFAEMSGVHAIMMSHVSYPELDSNGLPATFSRKIITNLLRTDLKFKGLVITDDLLMAGAKIHNTPGDSALAALRAGADLLMITWSRKSQTAAYQRVLKAFREKELTESRLNESLFRILLAKSSYFRKEDLINRKIQPTKIAKIPSVYRIQKRISVLVGESIREKGRKPASTTGF